MMDGHILFGQAYLLNKLGFDYPTKLFYCVEPFFGSDIHGRYEYKPGDIVQPHDVSDSIKDKIIPVWRTDQVCRWLAVEHNINIEITRTPFYTYCVYIHSGFLPTFFDAFNLEGDFPTYREAELRGITAVLKKFVDNDPNLYDEYVDELFKNGINFYKHCHHKH